MSCWSLYKEPFLHNTWFNGSSTSQTSQAEVFRAHGQRNFRTPNIISWGLSFIKFQDGTLNFISLANITSAYQWITDWQEHSWIMEQYRSLPVTAFCENGQTEQIELLGSINKTTPSPYEHLSSTHFPWSWQNAHIVLSMRKPISNRLNKETSDITFQCKTNTSKFQFEFSRTHMKTSFKYCYFFLFLFCFNLRFTFDTTSNSFTRAAPAFEDLFNTCIRLLPAAFTYWI